ncbi:GNAT family N-acetyltransferase [Streptomyces sp. NPDC026673]|uniref:GNAT family N-acetyltransferase n=1 Tax=Streptomyces sp. NPDC026673 TaxID=3155724 RepID=UPI0033DE4DB9
MPSHEPDPGSVVPVDDCPGPVRTGFAALAAQRAAGGIALLHRQTLAGAVGTVLAVVHEDRVAGVIDPVEIRLDAMGTRELMPQYFGVLPEHRGCGNGRALWRAAMYWGREKNSGYQLLQTKYVGPVLPDGPVPRGIVCSKLF